jgi:hypothetical protein
VNRIFYLLIANRHSSLERRRQRRARSIERRRQIAWRRRMPPKSTKATQDKLKNQPLASFFKPASSSTKRSIEVISLLDSDDEDSAVVGSSSKKVKAEDDLNLHQSNSIASTSSTPAPAPPSAFRPTAVTKTNRAEQWRFIPNSMGPTLSSQTAESISRHEAFANKLVSSRNRYNYTQTEQLRLGSNGDQGEMEEEEEEEGPEEDEDAEADKGNGKGKGKAKEKESKLAQSIGKFKGSTSSIAAATIKYTPLEKQVLVLAKANPGVVLM